MELYIANLTKQHYEFCYRLPESPSVRIQRIGIGKQIKIASNNQGLSVKEVDAIINQHVKYGLVPVDEMKKSKVFTGICYSLDKPISIDNIMLGIDRNLQVLVDRGKKNRQEAAVASHNLVEQALSESNSIATLDKMETTIEEEERRGTSGDDPGPSISEAVRVTRAHEGEPEVQRGRRGRRGGA